jgi:hypothetical protein
LFGWRCRAEIYGYIYFAWVIFIGGEVRQKYFVWITFIGGEIGQKVHL